MPFQIIDSQALCIFFASAVSVAPVGALHTAPRHNIQTGGEAQQPDNCAVADTSALHIAQNDRAQSLELSHTGRRTCPHAKWVTTLG